MAINGYPFVNFASDLRGTGAAPGTQTTSMVLPRPKYTFLARFRINPQWTGSSTIQTNLSRFIQNGRLYVPLKRIDHPKMTFKTETLRSYNKYVKFYTAVEFQPATIDFQDDTRSMARALWKEYLAFYSYAGDVGQGLLAGVDPRTSLNGEFRVGNDLTGQEVRQDMDIHPSIGMTLRGDARRHFFDNIIIYDLGTDPDRINIYYFVHPVFRGIDHGKLDYFDRTGYVDIRYPFEYENYYFVVGMNRNTIGPVISSILGISPEPANSSDGHAVMAPNAGSSSSSLGGLSPAEQQLRNEANALGIPIPGNPNTRLTRFLRNPPNLVDQAIQSGAVTTLPGSTYPSLNGNLSSQLNQQVQDNIAMTNNLYPGLNPPNPRDVLAQQVQDNTNMTNTLYPGLNASPRTQQAAAATLAAFGGL